MFKMSVIVPKILKILIDTLFAGRRGYILLDCGEIQFLKSLSRRKLMKRI